MTTSKRNIFLDLARYGRRANDELFEVLSRLTDRARRRDTGSHFGSVTRLVNHILIADMFWLKRFRPIFPESSVLDDRRLIPEKLAWGVDLRDEFSELWEERRYVDEGLIRWFEECPEECYELRFDYIDSSGATRSAVAVEAFEFLFLHQMHHRGQVSQILDAFGLPNNIADNGAFLDPR